MRYKSKRFFINPLSMALCLVLFVALVIGLSPYAVFS
jgi:hypothetical protein